MVCPRCGFAQGSTPECGRCGLVFAKYHAEREASSQGAGPSRRTLALVGGGFAALLALGALIAVVLAPEPPPPPPRIEAPPLRELEAQASGLGCPRALGPGESMRAAAQAADAAPPGWSTGRAAYDAPGGAETSVLIYVTAPWCTYGKGADLRLFADPAVAERLKELRLVRILPESSPEDAKLADQLGVSVYPSLYVVPTGGKPEHLRIFRDVDDKIVVLRPPEFLAALEAVLE